MSLDGTPASPVEDLSRSIADEAARVEEDALYSATGHFEGARGWVRWHMWIGIPTTVAAAIAGVSAINNQPIASGILAFTAAVSSALATFLDPKALGTAHLAAGNAFKALHNTARIFRLIDCQSSKDVRELQKFLERLNKTRNKLNGESPQLPRWAFKRARKGLEEGTAAYAVDRALEDNRQDDSAVPSSVASLIASGQPLKRESRRFHIAFKSRRQKKPRSK